MSAKRGDAGLLDMQSLELQTQDWDSYGGKPITQAAIETARKVMGMLLESSPYVVPLSDGGIQLEWHERGIDLEFEIDPDGKLPL